MKVVKVSEYEITFDCGYRIYSNHESDCCEEHYIDFNHVSMDDFEGLDFDLTGDSFFNRVCDYGIELIPISGHPVRIPGYAYNNGYYSDNLSLLVESEGKVVRYDISECQAEAP